MAAMGEESYKYKKKEHQNELQGDGLESEVSMFLWFSTIGKKYKNIDINMSICVYTLMHTRVHVNTCAHAHTYPLALFTESLPIAINKPNTNIFFLDILH